MDEQKNDDNQDLTMNMDGSMTTDQGQKIEVTSAPTVNDIEPPVVGDTTIPADPEEESSSDPSQPESAPTPEPATAEVSQPESQEADVMGSNTPVEPPAEDASPSSSPEQAPAPQQVEQPEQEDKTLAEVGVAMSQTRDKHQHEHRNNKKVALIVTLFTALLLAGIAVYVYVSANNTTEPTASETPNQNEVTQTEEVAQPATPEDVEGATQELETAIDSVDTATDFNESELSDQSLGL